MARTGLAAQETILTPANVSGLKILFQTSLDGNVYAQPLCVTNQAVFKNGVLGKADVVFVATEHGSVYAIDAKTGATYWRVSLLDQGFSPIPVTDPKAKCAHIAPEESITATPVIDRNAGPHGQIFVVAMEVVYSTTGIGNYNYKLHALDLATGKDALTPTIISASVSGTFNTTFVPIKERCRPGLLLLNGTLYFGFGAFCETKGKYSGWLLGYRESDLSQAAVFNDNPNGMPPGVTYLKNGSGGGIWQSGLGPSTDGTYVYVEIGNGPFDTTLSGGFPANQDIGDSALKLSTTNGLSVSDYFTPFNVVMENSSDADLGSGGMVILPDIVDTNGNHHQLAVAIGKDSNIYLLDRNNMGKFNASTNNIYQEILQVNGHGSWSSIAYFNNSIYCAGRGTTLKRFQFDFSNPDKPVLNTTPAAQTKRTFAFPAFTPSISANGTANGIVWGYELFSTTIAVLHAYDATTLAELYNSDSLLGPGVKFAIPTVCNGRVYVGTLNSLVAFGL